MPWHYLGEQNHGRLGNPAGCGNCARVKGKWKTKKQKKKRGHSGTRWGIDFLHSKCERGKKEIGCATKWTEISRGSITEKERGGYEKCKRGWIENS